jgi:hypothetical protein
MNQLIHDYFDAIETRLIASPIVAVFDVIRREVTSTDGKIRIRATLTDGVLLELFEYVVEDQGQLHAEVQLPLAKRQRGTDTPLGQRQSLSRSAKCSPPHAPG